MMNDDRGDVLQRVQSLGEEEPVRKQTASTNV
jgi:hypothetical protein